MFFSLVPEDFFLGVNDTDLSCDVLEKNRNHVIRRYFTVPDPGFKEKLSIIYFLKHHKIK